jgi:hypothetical protein
MTPTLEIFRVDVNTVKGVNQLKGAHVKLVQVRGDCNDGKACPSLYRTDRGSVLARGLKVTDAEALEALGLPDHETVVELPAEMLAEVLRDAE